MRISPKKVKPVLDIVRGKNVAEAKRILQFDSTKAAERVLKVLNSAIANAKVANLSEKGLFVSDLQVNWGPVFKRMRIVGKSNTSPILKRTSHILVGLSSEGKERVWDKK